MIPSARATALRSTALATSLALAVGLAAFPLDAWANPKVPLPKPRPIARNVVPKPATQAGTPAAAHAPTTAAPAFGAPVPGQSGPGFGGGAAFPSNGLANLGPQPSFGQAPQNNPWPPR